LIFLAIVFSDRRLGLELRLQKSLSGVLFKIKAFRTISLYLKLCIEETGSSFHGKEDN